MHTYVSTYIYSIEWTCHVLFTLEALLEGYSKVTTCMYKKCDDDDEWYFTKRGVKAY